MSVDVDLDEDLEEDLETPLEALGAVVVVRNLKKRARHELEPGERIEIASDEPIKVEVQAVRAERRADE